MKTFALLDEQQTGPIIKSDLPKIAKVAEDLTPDGTCLYIGGGDAARDTKTLERLGISILVNCALNLETHYVHPETDADPTGAVGRNAFRHYHVGLIDGPGNTAGMVLAGVLVAEGALRQRIPDKLSYPYRQTGHLLIHCRAGRSRSVAIGALLMARLRPDLYPDLETALAVIRARRPLAPTEWNAAPKHELRVLMAEAWEMLQSIGDRI